MRAENAFASLTSKKEVFQETQTKYKIQDNYLEEHQEHKSRADHHYQHGRDDIP